MKNKAFGFSGYVFFATLFYDTNSVLSGPDTVFPAVNQPVGKTVRYHNRTGKHDVTDYDWEQYLRFADELVR